MKKNRMFKTILAACAALMLSGCFKIRITMNVNKDATADGAMEVLLSESMFSMYGGDIEEGIDAFEAQYREQYPDAKIERLIEGEEGSRFGGVKVYELPIEDSKITKDGNTIRVEIPLGEMQAEIENESDMGMGKTSIDALKGYGAEALLTINMPGNAEANAGTVDGKTVTLDLLEKYDTDTLIITCKTGPSALLIAGISAAVLAVIALVLILRGKKKTA